MEKIVTCPTCQALFIDGEHYWAWNKKKGNAKDLAGLVCNPHSKGRTCINPCYGDTTGDTWEKRAGDLKALDEKLRVDSSSSL